MVSDERIRSLCDRVVKSKGADFQAAILELQQAIEARIGFEENNGNSHKE